ncbi:D-beta-D-heptose 7-phosphate kinase/D-beta-D-heptose 1-phosphate adenosyltransferase [Bathymodiolus japonicus methanotrophic gill symbiont]|uniref:bifunctional D-glycero-beta-D-manno-heptose-7-phosphate kinase/D-glycero-beta-D-manno-heptose 1-phosphate adenylyltransferase HldE n=1 Tax=Bathymodiolus japonicus methanotrophic gill symbiont TaxID=113269 RepID=UPI001B75A7CF|nr:bifunctional D-glycero-beta-D-manno-heptose-7-phosphate kinase/D-glycero-beta-D-manno-heptose 1-phosphate adenylyltransferase HldE [Bathymodiolus japonicus methanotrophic gill symbiont]GFO72175.1 D-beta-D-heptose 7-phosphate kinase/D-beta-D-heptose 1-phosphate adenosyltransferase [Bathymodiolus japonicus methanotrophic gill symbiont]
MISEIPDFKGLNILVVGDLMLDYYWSGQTSRVSPEAPVPIVKVTKKDARAGGAGNVALNIASLAANVKLLGIVGNDTKAGELENLLAAKGVSCDFIKSTHAPTTCKLRIVAQHQQLIRLDFEESLVDFNYAELLEHYSKALTTVDVVIFSDYAKGVLAHIPQLLELANKQGVQSFVDPKGSDFSRYQGATLITPNRAEFQAVVGECQDNKQLVSKGQTLLTQYNIDALLVTLSEHGMALIKQDAAHFLPTHAREVFDVTGAGDTVISSMALGVASGLDLQHAMHLANMAAGIVVGKFGTSTVSSHELNRALHGDKENISGVVTEDELQKEINFSQHSGEKVVMTNGCFDILHAGHVAYLEQARLLGDRLVVAINSDESVQQLKGESRPINKLADRMTIIAALGCVDWVIPFFEETPERIYHKFLPDVLVKGGDYKPEDVVGAEAVITAGGKVEILDFVAGKSTTTTIERIKKQ